MASIFDKVQEKRDAMHEAFRRNDPAPLIENANLAIAAIHEGVNSQAWETYMKQFVHNDNPDQLARLMATDGTVDDPAFRMHRAYLLGNAVCATTTDTGLHVTVNTIDGNIPGSPGCSPEPAVESKMRISIQRID
jgi:hypothetical protein